MLGVTALEADVAKVLVMCVLDMIWLVCCVKCCISTICSTPRHKKQHTRGSRRLCGMMHTTAQTLGGGQWSV